MHSIIPKKLKKGDEIRIISPSRSLSIISEDMRKIATNRLTDLGFKVTFSEHVEETDEFNSSSIKSRVDDLHAAFRDKNVKGILTTIGGFNSNQLLTYLNYDLIKKNPKILCGYSDITALQNAIYKKTGLVTYSGPHYSTFGMLKGFEYTQEYFNKCLMQDRPFEIIPSKEWSDDAWYKDQDSRKFIKNTGFRVINDGEAKGTIIGANLCTFNLLQGTEYMPNLKDKILFIEDDEESKPQHFDRDLQSLIHQPGFDDVKGLIIGRFQNASNIPYELLTKIIMTKKELEHLPIVYGLDFGHTAPYLTFPIGGTIDVYAKGNKVKIEVLKH